MAIQAFRDPWKNLGDPDDLVPHLFRRLLNSLPPPAKFFPSCDLQVVLDALTRPPFEPLDVDLKWLTWKAFSLVAIISARHLGELGALCSTSLF